MFLVVLDVFCINIANGPLQFGPQFMEKEFNLDRYINVLQ